MVDITRDDDLRELELGPFLTGRVLVVDDEPEHLILLETFLEDDWDVRTARGGAEALEILRAESVDVIVADQRMPGMSGVELLRDSARLQPDATRIMLTAYTDTESMIGAINEGQVYRFLQKPWQPHLLTEALKEGSERCAYRRALAHFVGELRQKNADLEKALEARHAAEATLLHAERLATVGQLAASVVHEVRNHLQVMQGLMDEIQEDASLSDDLRSFVEFGVQSLDMTYQTLDDVERFARRESSPIGWRAPADLNEIIAQAVGFAQLDRSLKSAKIEEHYGELPRISVDPAKLRQVVQNLLRNASQAVTDETPRVVVRTGVAADDVRVTIEDNGPGVPPENRERIWEPFFSTRGQGGLGLGLHICRQIMTAHGGDLVYEDRPEGGARFVMILPRKLPDSVRGEAVLLSETEDSVQG